MGRYDCVVMYNAANVVEIEGCREKAYPSTILREEVGAVEDALREGGFNPYVPSVERFSKELVALLLELSPRFIFNLCEEINGETELEMCVAGLLEMNSSSLCRNPGELESQAAYIHSIYNQAALVEEYLDGREFNVSILGDGDARVLAISEIDFNGMPEGEPRIVSYRAKWDEESEYFRTTQPVCPAPLGKRLENRIKDMALRAYGCIDCRDYGRVDMRTDARGNLFVLEVNPNPDIAPSAGFARASQAAGYSYADIILRISQLALERVGASEDCTDEPKQPRFRLFAARTAQRIG